MKPSTKAVHVGQEPDGLTGSVIPPIYQTTTFAQTAPGKPVSEFDYTRAGNPNFTNLEKTLAALEDARHATVFSSGLGALTSWVLAAGKGRIVTTKNIYGGTFRLLTAVFKNYGVEQTILDRHEPEHLIGAIKKNTKWILIESPTNPLLDIIDIRAVAKEAHKKGVRLIVDNTFATPILQKPIELGADVVLHSTTKYLGGHSDVVGGALITNDGSLKNEYDFFRKAVGVNPSPFDCWLVSRGLKTLVLRMGAHENNAGAIAHELKKSKLIRDVYYPGLTSHQGHDTAKKQMNGFGGIVSVRFQNPSQADRFVRKLKFFSLAESLGGVESLVCIPSKMTHASIPENERLKLGVDDALVRMSVGIEDKEDLLEDVRAALKSL